MGAVTNLSLYVLFLLLVWAGGAPLLISALCYVLGVIMSYLLNRRWTFASRSSHSHDLPRFLLAYGIGLGTTLVSMNLLINLLRPAIAQILTIGVTALSIYASLYLMRFGQPD
ncbi:GtrA family protein [Microvirga arabica]|uniref:GtrA family protein n=1 Tax=Microvirga arabica TaxID=1128671 RepID=UPI0028A5EB17|nr:GtrA family protein [Microvirga arabica]